MLFRSKQLDEIKADRDELLDKLHRAETELEAEKNRKLSLKERIFGKKDK